MCKLPEIYPIIFILVVVFFDSSRFQRQWKEAAVMARTLLEENNWSKATSCFLLATFQFEDNNSVATDEIIQLY
ncbi:unnamed protein product, partial [Rotaria magnacalcarata]